MRRLVIAVQLVLAAILVAAVTAPALHAAAAKRPPHRSTCHKRAHRRSGCRQAVLSFGALDPAAASGGLIAGLNADAAGWGGPSTESRLGQVESQTGTQWLREAFEWAKIEPKPGVFDFSYYDHFMLLAAQRGLHILALLYDTPAWAGANPSAIPPDSSSYAAYAAAVVNRYGPHGSFWAQHPDLTGSAIRVIELWNEPFFSTGDGGLYDPGRYARLVKAAALAAHAADPSVGILMAAEMQSAMTNGRWLWWVDALYRAVPDLNRYFDGVAVHDYGTDTTTLHPIVPGQPYNNYSHILRIENLRHQFVAHGAADKPFWITEIGWSTCTQAGATCVSEAQQAQNLSTVFGYVHGIWSGWVQAVFVYRYSDGTQPATVQDAYGLTHLDGTAKPALSVFRTAAAGG